MERPPASAMEGMARCTHLGEEGAKTLIGDGHAARSAQLRSEHTREAAGLCGRLPRCVGGGGTASHLLELVPDRQDIADLPLAVGAHPCTRSPIALDHRLPTRRIPCEPLGSRPRPLLRRPRDESSPRRQPQELLVPGEPFVPARQPLLLLGHVLEEPPRRGGQVALRSRRGAALPSRGYRPSEYCERGSGRWRRRLLR